MLKLKHNRINGKLLLWISNYLSNRKQKVIVKSSSSSLQVVTAGVPQGSVLGPLLFLINVNDIAVSVLSLTGLFADESFLYFSGSSLDDIEGLMDHGLRIVFSWASQWLVNINPNKTEAMLFTIRNVDNLPSLIFNDTPIHLVDHHKHLGVTFSCDGKWNKHVENISQSALKVIYIMRKLKRI